MSTEVERNKRLDALVTATVAWGEKRTTELQTRVSYAKKILKGRTGSERLAQAAVEAGSELVVDAIDEFLRT